MGKIKDELFSGKYFSLILQVVEAFNLMSNEVK